MNIISKIVMAVNGGAKLEDVIPNGASLKDWERIVDNYTNPRKPKPRRERPDNGRRKSSKSRMDSRVGWATLELVSRVNGIPFDGSASDSPDEITGRDYYDV